MLENGTLAAVEELLADVLVLLLLLLLPQAPSAITSPHAATKVADQRLNVMVPPLLNWIARSGPLLTFDIINAPDGASQRSDSSSPANTNSATSRANCSGQPSGSGTIPP